MALLRTRILGCGSSGGVPRLGGRWGACDPNDPRNRRTRCSLLVERIEGGQTTRVLIDTSPDMRAQLLAAEVGELDAVVYTHAHADHVHGIDDLRMIVFNRGSILPVWADSDTSRALKSRFAYAFKQPKGSLYRPILDLNRIDGAFSIDGPGGAIPFQPLPVQHGRMVALGFRMFGLAYMPDVSDIPETVWDQLGGLDCWILDALRRKPHPTHTHLARSLEWIERAAPRRAVLTNMHNDLDYATVAAEVPENVTPACDGLVLEFEI
jgi:phosphoribosyl 1,2-cyclic phosphate phosphodiesterase